METAKIVHSESENNSEIESQLEKPSNSFQSNEIEGFKSIRNDRKSNGIENDVIDSEKSRIDEQGWNVSDECIFAYQNVDFGGFCI